MKNIGRALLLLTLGLVLMSQAAMAQDALSVILPSPYSSRVGSQLMYFFEDSSSGSRGNIQSFLTVTNTNISNGVNVHYQFYVSTSASSTNGCLELFDFVDYLSPGKTHIIDPRAVKGASAGGLFFATEGRFIMTVTPVQSGTTPADLRAVAFNWLSGQIWVSDINKSATWMTNAVPRMAVDSLGGPLVDGTILLGSDNGNWLQMFRPIIISVNTFFKTAGAGAVQPGVPFGNRLTLVTFADQYTNAQQMYRILPTTANLNSFVFDNDENAFSVPSRPISCITEYTIAPDVPGSSCSGQTGLCSNGNFADFLGTALSSAVNTTGGWLRMRVSSYGANQSILGWFSQYLGTFGGGDFLVGQGRAAQTGLFITVSNGAGGTLSTASTTY